MTSDSSQVGGIPKPATAAVSARTILVPLALAQFIASSAGSNMNVAINSISDDLGTTVHGVQTAITLFLLTMAALMIPGSKVTDISGSSIPWRRTGRAPSTRSPRDAVDRGRSLPMRAPIGHRGATAELDVAPARRHRHAGRRGESASRRRYVRP